MPEIRANADYVTMINYFTVNPDDQAGLMRVQMEDIDLFGRKQPAMLAASFHASADGTRVFNYAHWTSLEGLRAWRSSPDMAAHLMRMKPFDFEVDPHPYQVSQVWATGARPCIEPEPSFRSALAMVECEADRQARLAERLADLMTGMSKDPPDGLTASWLAVSSDGVRIAIYLQFSSSQACDQFRDGRHADAIRETCERHTSSVEIHAYSVGSTGYKSVAGS